MNRTFFHCTSSRSASLARRSRSDVWRRDLRQLVGQLLAAIPDIPCRDSRSVRWTTRSGIAADRRREVRVAVGRQAEVAEVRRVVARLLHRPQHQEGDRLFFRLAARSARRAAESAAAGPRRAARRGCSRASRRTPRTPPPSADRAPRGRGTASARRAHRDAPRPSRSPRSMNSSMIRCAMLRSAATISSTMPSSSSTISGSFRSKSIDPRRRRRSVENLEQLAHRLEHRHELAVVARSSSGRARSGSR